MISSSVNLTSFVLFTILLTFLILWILWRRRWLYYSSWKLPGPFAWPLIGNALEFLKSPDDVFNIIRRHTETYPDIFTLWIGPHLHLVTSRPEDASVLLGECLEKSVLYVNDECMKDGIVVSPVRIWKGRRKIINKTFNQKVLDSYTEDLARSTRKMVEELSERKSGLVEMVPVIWKYSVYSLCETLLDLDASTLVGVEKYIDNVKRFEKITVARVLQPWLRSNFLYRLSTLGREMKEVSGHMEEFIDHIMKQKSLSFSPVSDKVKRKRYLNYLFSLMKSEELEEHDVALEMQNMMIAGTETSSYALCYAILILGFKPEVQDKAYQELRSIFEDDDRDATLDDVNKMEYLERVLKETMRFFPPIPFVMRYLDKSVEISSQVYPAGCNVIVPFLKIHKDASQWPDPEHFDPDRFLPQEVDKRHKGAYLAFSFGPRNCPGWKLGLTSMKIMLAAILRSFTIQSVNYQKLEDVEVVYGILMYPKDNCQVVLTKRNKNI